MTVTGFGDSSGMCRVPPELPGHQPCPGRQRLQGFTCHVLPSWGNLQRFFQRKLLPLLPCLYSLEVFPSISGSGRSSWEGAQRQGWQCPLASIICAGLIASLLAQSLCWDKQLPWLLAFHTSGAVGKLLMIGGTD